MTRRWGVALVAALIFIVVTVAFWTLDGDDEADEFRAFEAGDEQLIDDVGVVPTSGYRRAGPRASDRPAPRPAPGRSERSAATSATQTPDEDTLNRPGPEPSTIANGRPDRGEVEAASTQDEPSGGVLDKDDIQSGIRAVQPLVKVCYESLLDEFSEARGKVTLGFRIAAEDGEGRVELTELDEEKTTLFDEKMHDCMMQSIAEAKFAAPGGGGIVTVTYPFIFETDAEPEPGE